jgi:hypothetical protein
MKLRPRSRRSKRKELRREVLGKNDEICNITAKSDGVVNENCDLN